MEETYSHISAISWILHNSKRKLNERKRIMKPKCEETNYLQRGKKKHNPRWMEMLERLTHEWKSKLEKSY